MAPRLPVRLFDEYRILRLIGSGRGGLVYLAEEIHSGHLCAIKEYPLLAETSQRFFRELGFLFTLRHPHLVQCRNFYHGTDCSSALILEYADLGSLRHYLQSQPEQRLSSDRLLSLARQATAGLCALHKLGIVHCDIKPENLLLFADADQPILKVADFDIALLQSRQDNTTPTHGSPLYMAPEQFYQKPGPSADFYSLALVLGEALVGHPLRQPGTPEEIFTQSQRGIDWECITDPHWRMALSRMAHTEPSARPVEAEEINALWDQVAARSTTLPSTQPQHSPSIPSVSRSTTVPIRPATIPSIPYHSWTTPGVQKIYPHPLPGLISLCDDGGLDSVEFSTRRVTPRVFSGRVQCLSPDSLWLAQAHQVHRWNPTTKRYEHAFPIPQPPEQILSTPFGDLILADHRMIRLYSSSGIVHAEWEVPNYVFRPQLVWWRDTIWVTSGPLHPALHALRPGQPTRALSLPGPALSLLPGHHHLHILCQGPTPDDEGHWLQLPDAEGNLNSLRTAPPLMHRARPLADSGFSVFDLEDQITFLMPSPDNDLQWANGTKPLDDLWLPEAQAYFLLFQVAHQAVLHYFEISAAPLTEPLRL